MSKFLTLLALALLLCPTLQAQQSVFGPIQQTFGARRAAGGAAPATIPQFDNSIVWIRNTDSNLTDYSFVGTNHFYAQAGAALSEYVSPTEGRSYDGTDWDAMSSGNYILNGLTAITWSVWISNTTWSVYDGLICARGTKYHAIAFDDTPSEFVIYTETVYRFASNAVAWTNAGWSHLVATYDFGKKETFMYVNGIQIHYSTTAYTNTKLSGQTDVLKIAFDDGASDRKFVGRLDDVLIYKTALTSNEVLQLTGFGH